jgi:hypothetical protein
MEFGAVALVPAETIFWKTAAEVTHDFIARHFCDHARGSDAETDAVPVDDCRLRKWKWKNRQPVDENVIRRRGERRNCSAHRFMCGAQNVDGIDLDGIYNRDGPMDLGVFGKINVNFLA